MEYFKPGPLNFHSDARTNTLVHTYPTPNLDPFECTP